MNENVAKINQGIDQLEALMRDTIVPAVARMERHLKDTGCSESLASMVASDYAGRLMDIGRLGWVEDER